VDLYTLIVGGTFSEDFKAAPASVQASVMKAVYMLLGGPLPGLCELDIQALDPRIQGLYTAVVPGVAGLLTYHVDSDSRAVELLRLEWL
jgi:hypothetical protein